LAGLPPRPPTQRQLERRLRRSRRRLLTVAVAAALLVCLSLLAALRSPYLALQTITVRGNSLVSRDEIVAAAGLTTGTSMLRVRPRAAEDLVAAALPRVAAAEVRLVWPHGVCVTVSERTSLLGVLCGDGWLEVAADGVVVALHDASQPDAASCGLFLLAGLDPAQLAVGRSVPGSGSGTMIGALSAVVAMGEAVASAELSKNHLNIALGDGTLLMLGPLGGDILTRTGSALSVLAELRRAGKRVAYIDARLSGQPVIRLR